MYTKQINENMFTNTYFKQLWKQLNLETPFKIDEDRNMRNLP